MPIWHEKQVLISIRKWMRSMERSNLMPLWGLIEKIHSKSTKIIIWLHFFSFFFFFLFLMDCLSVKDEQQVWQNLSLSPSPHCSAML